MKVATQEAAQRYLYSFRSKGDRFGLGGAGFDFGRVLFLAKLVGNPQNKIKVIHVAGTSGKGSTCAFLSKFLAAHSKKVGLSISPHMFDLRERIQINNKLISEKFFLKYLNELIPFIEKVDVTKYGNLTFFEIMIVLAYYIFQKEHVDYAVMETGLGGRLDATNIATAKNKIAVITKLGIDHTDMLGNTIESISTEKAQIIHKNNTVLTVDQEPAAQKVILTQVKLQDSIFHQIHQSKTYTNISLENSLITFDFKYKELHLRKLSLSIPAEYQVENASLALATIYEVSKRDDFNLEESVIRKTLLNIHIPGRFQELYLEGKKIIIDGAHNPQKMSVFIEDLKKRHSKTLFDFLLGFKKGKDYEEMLTFIVPISKDIFVTEFHGDDQDRIIIPEKAAKIRALLNDAFFAEKVTIYSDPIKAMEKAQKKHDTILVITGSLYMISAILKELKE